MKSLSNYRRLVAKVDELCTRITGEFGEHLTCRAGCDGCCRHLTLFWVEGIALTEALRELPAEQAHVIREQARAATPDGPCPLLINGLCSLYEARPLICRTHGFPILTIQDGTTLVDFCPQNFRSISTLPGSAVIDLERLNAALASINALFMTDVFGIELPDEERLSVADALLLDAE